ncbi:MAG: helix-turn-helix domain-containing protein [Turicibacter sp.]|nr:helix-turn-helix domain-containing protein [Turicibacter sp.]
MQPKYINDNENIYYRCRKEAATYNEVVKSRESASEALNISPSALANYERGVTKVIPPESVANMAKIYNAPELSNHYCAHECPIGRGQPIATAVNSLELGTIKMLKTQEQAEFVKKIGSDCDRHRTSRAARFRGTTAVSGRNGTINRRIAAHLPKVGTRKVRPERKE